MKKSAKNCAIFFVGLLLIGVCIPLSRGGKPKKRLDTGAQIKKEIDICLNGTRDHVSAKINEAKVVEYPFPHLIVDEILPPHLYKEIAKRWPDEQLFKGVRGAIPVNYGASESFPLDLSKKHFWRIFGEVVVDRYIKPKIVEKFLPYLYQKYRMNSIGLEFVKRNINQCFANSRQDGLILDRGGYEISPHVDQLNMFVQILIYLPKEGDTYSEDLGTCLYESEEAKIEDIDYTGAIYRHYGDCSQKKEVKLCKKVPYRPNQLVVFLQSPLAWHGVDPVPPGQVRRLFFSPLKFSPEFMEDFYEEYPRSLIQDYFFESRFMDAIKNSNIWDENYTM